MESDEDYNSEEEELKSTSSFTDYVPSIAGTPHPGPVKESTSLAFVESAAPLSRLRSHPLQSGLSALQYETCCRIMDVHATHLPNGCRRGFLLGDGTGLGKGRQIAGVIKENYSLGKKKAIWISTSMSLQEAAEKDFIDIGIKTMKLKISNSLNKGHSEFVGIPVFALTQVKNVADLAGMNGVLFTTYSTLISTSPKNKTSRLLEIFAFMGSPEFDGIIAFDECHKAKSYNENEKKSTATGTAVMKLQNYAKSARIVYASATGATELDHLSYMDRLGLWGTGTTFENANTFIAEMKTRGVGALELLAVNLKSRGIYASRQIGFDNIQCNFQIVDLSEEWIRVYEYSVSLFQNLLKLQSFISGRDISPINESHFWASQQRYYSSLCTACKVDSVLQLAKELLCYGKCVVIGLQHTGESAMIYNEKHKNGLKNSVLLFYLMECLRAFGFKETTIKITEDHLSPKKPKLCQNEWTFPINITNNEPICTKLLKDINMIYFNLKTMLLPVKNALDLLISGLGGEKNVAELTGRATRLVQDKVLSRRDSKKEGNVTTTVNNIERRAFQSGKKMVAIISDAASTGFSLHAEAIPGNVAKQRVHITIELPWSADKVVQQLGRTHRSNQVLPPRYIFMFTNIPSECRFICTISNRLQQLGAIMNADRRLNTFNIPCQFGKSNEDLNESIYEIREALIRIGVIIEKDYKYYVSARSRTIEKFLNRLFCSSMKMQERVLELLSDQVDAEIKKAKKMQNYDDGIKDFSPPKNSQHRLIKTEKYNFAGKNVELNEIELDKGMSFGRVKGFLEALIKRKGDDAIFFMRGTQIIMCIPLPVKAGSGRIYDVYSPATGKMGKMKMPDLRFLNYEVIKEYNEESIKSEWTSYYNSLIYSCRHLKSVGNCEKQNCQSGSRRKKFYVLSGDILDVWEDVSLRVKPFVLSTMRIKIDAERTVIGARIPIDFVEIVRMFFINADLRHKV